MKTHFANVAFTFVEEDVMNSSERDVEDRHVDSWTQPASL